MHYPEYIKSKNLYRKAMKALDTLNDIKFYSGAYDLQLEKQDIETKNYLYLAIDSLKGFIDNLDLIDNE